MVATRIEEKGLARQLIHLLKVYGPQDEDLADKVRKLLHSTYAYHSAPLLNCLVSIQQILQTVIGIFRHSNKSLSPDEINELRAVLPQLRNHYGTVALNKDEWDELEKYVNG